MFVLLVLVRHQWRRWRLPAARIYSSIVCVHWGLLEGWGRRSGQPRESASSLRGRGWPLRQPSPERPQSHLFYHRPTLPLYLYSGASPTPWVRQNKFRIQYCVMITRIRWSSNLKFLFRVPTHEVSPHRLSAKDRVSLVAKLARAAAESFVHKFVRTKTNANLYTERPFNGKLCQHGRRPTMCPTHTCHLACRPESKL